MEHNNIDSCIEEWETLSNEYRSLEKLHKLYQAKLEEVNSLQQKCTKGISHQRYRLNIIKTSLKRLGKSVMVIDGEEKERNNMLQTDLIRRKAQLYEMENILPKPSGRYLKIILGNINVSILDKNERFRYKDEYEKFKLVMSLIALGVSIINCFTNYRTMDLIHMFLLVWYYCTLTIRESILKVNGSRMKGWWRAHHFISTVLAGVMLIWPVGECYYLFRTQFMAFNVYISFVQYLQFMYQRGCLYRLKCLGQSHNMDITVEGFQSWMWKGLGFLLPFLFIGYFWELYQAYTLYNLMMYPSADWHIGTLCLLFMLLFLGNSITTAAIIPQKLKERFKLKYRFTRLDKYIWTHKKRRVSFRHPESNERRTPAARAASFNRKMRISKEEPTCTDVPQNREVSSPKVAAVVTSVDANAVTDTSKSVTMEGDQRPSNNNSTQPETKGSSILTSSTSSSTGSEAIGSEDDPRNVAKQQKQEEQTAENKTLENDNSTEKMLTSGDDGEVSDSIVDDVTKEEFDQVELEEVFSDEDSQTTTDFEDTESKKDK
uniref:Transmembrane protein 120 homolog n=1 Tax=Hirondellea gigas TaxID=1518452 RepID=A0A2P2I1D8_9CRUS